MDWSGQVYAQYLMWTHKSHDATTCPHGVPPRSGEMRRLPSETLRTSGNLEVHVGFARSPDAFASDEFFSPLLALSVRCWPTMRTGNPGLATNMPTDTFSSARGDLHAFPNHAGCAHGRAAGLHLPQPYRVFQHPEASFVAPEVGCHLVLLGVELEPVVREVVGSG